MLPPHASALPRSCPRLSSPARRSSSRLRLPLKHLLHVLQPDELFSLPLLDGLLDVPDRGFVPRNYHVLQRVQQALRPFELFREPEDRVLEFCGLEDGGEYLPHLPRRPVDRDVAVGEAVGHPYVFLGERQLSEKKKDKKHQKELRN